MKTEIERKFLVLNEDYKEKAEVVSIQQGFLCADSTGVVRIRIEGMKATITIKGQTTGLERTEFEYEIPLNDAEFLLENNCIRPTIKKKRYKTVYEGFLWEIDKFMDENEGLVIAEIELPETHTTFKIPEWVGEEVTNNPKYYNASLATKPFKSW